MNVTKISTTTLDQLLTILPEDNNEALWTLAALTEAVLWAIGESQTDFAGKIENIRLQRDTATERKAN